MSSYNNLGSVSDWQMKKSILNAGQPRIQRSDVSSDSSSMLKTINGSHGRFMDSVSMELESADDLITNANSEYESMMSAVENAIRLVGQCEENGLVSNDSQNNQYVANASQTSSLGSSTLNNKPARADAASITDVPTSSLSSSTKDTPNTSSALNISSIPSSDLSSSVTDTPTTAAAIAVSGVPASSLASNLVDGQETSAAKSVEAVAGAGAQSSLTPMSTTPNTFGEQSVGSGTWSKLSSQEQTNVVGKLQQVGYTETEITQITSGEASVPKVMVDSLSYSLEKEAITHPEMKKELLETYGFDIFNEDGTVDNEKLALALIVDSKDEDDEYNIIQFLKEKYDIDIVDPEMMEEIEKQLLELEEEIPDIRAKLLQRYGFDIFKEDRSISKDKLVLAILMDRENENDEFDLISFLKKFYEKWKNEKESKSKQKGIGLLGAASIGAAIVTKRIKEEKENNKRKEEHLDNIEEQESKVL